MNKKKSLIMGSTMIVMGVLGFLFVFLVFLPMFSVKNIKFTHTTYTFEGRKYFIEHKHINSGDSPGWKNMMELNLTFDFLGRWEYYDFLEEVLQDGLLSEVTFVVADSSYLRRVKLELDKPSGGIILRPLAKISRGG